MPKKLKHSPTMRSRTQIIQRLSALTKFRFVSYLDTLSNDTHLVLLHVNDFEGAVSHSALCQVTFVVTECVGYLSAVSIDGSLHIEKLS